MKTLRTYIGVGLILLITICAIFVSYRLTRGRSVDLTENDLYSLSTGTENIINKLNQPVKFKLYYSRQAALNGPEQIRQYNNYFRYVRDLLREYVRLSKGKIRLSVIDPRPFSSEEQDAMEAGLQGVPLSADETFYFGLVAQTELGKEKTIPFFQMNRQTFIEYDISRLLVNLTRREKKKIGVLSSLSITGGDMSPYMRQMMQMQGREVEQSWKIIDKLKDRYEIVNVKADATEIDENLGLLMVVHPKDLPEKTLYAIDQYVMKGGKLLVFVDPHCLADQPKQNQQKPMAAMQHDASSTLNGLLEQWGVRMKDKSIAADMDLGVETRLRRNQPASILPVYLNLNREVMNQEQVITGQLGAVRMLFAGVLERSDKGDGEMVPLLSTSKDGRVWKPRSPQAFRMLDAQRIRSNMTGEAKKYILGVMLPGPFKTNYSEGAPESETPDDGEEEKNATNDGRDGNSGPPLDANPTLQKSSEEATVVVFTDVDMMSDMLTYREGMMGMSQEVDDNAALILNAVEFLGGTTDLIHIRSRGRVRRPFEVFERIRAQTEEATSKKIDKLNQQIQEYRRKLWQLEDSAGEDELMGSSTVQKRKQIQQEIRDARQTIRKLNADRREKIESLKASIQFHNLVWAPLFVLLIAIGLSIFRYLKARHYAARRKGE